MVKYALLSVAASLVKFFVKLAVVGWHLPATFNFSTGVNAMFLSTNPQSFFFR
jgi:hypothetical protein